MSAPPVLRVERAFPFSAESVFDAWLDAAALGRWLFATPGGVMKKISVEPFVGGAFEVIEQRGDVAARHVGAYVEIDRPRRLAFDFCAGAEGGALSAPTRVTVEINPEGADACRLILTHEGVWKDYEQRTRDGWTMILGALAKSLEGRNRGRIQ